MGLFARYNALDRIIVCTVGSEHEQLPAERTQVLCCDSKGNLSTAIYEISVLEIAQNAVTQLLLGGKWAATLSMEIAPGQSATFAVEVSAEEAEALGQVEQSAFEVGVIPDYLKKYTAQIIKLGESRRKELREEYEQRSRLLVLATPELVEHWANSSDGFIHIEVPSNKSDIAEPAIVVRRLPANEQTRPDMQRVLMLDYEGTLAIVRIPIEAIDDAEREFQQWRNENNAFGVIVLRTTEDGLMMGPMEIRESQKKALGIVERHWEETGCSMRDMPTDVQAILVKARTMFVMIQKLKEEDV
jgi:hypothetical protein